MKYVTIHQAKTHLSRLIAEVEAGEDVIIARGRTPVAKLTAIVRKAPQKRLLGKFSGTFATDGQFDSPLPEDLVESVEAPLL